jgi:hypothetical protein
MLDFIDGSCRSALATLRLPGLARNHRGGFSSEDESGRGNSTGAG